MGWPWNLVVFCSEKGNDRGMITNKDRDLTNNTADFTNTKTQIDDKDKDLKSG